MFIPWNIIKYKKTIRAQKRWRNFKFILLSEITPYGYNYNVNLYKKNYMDITEFFSCQGFE